MRSKNLIILAFFFTTAGIFSQSNLNSFKYVIVPKKFEFLKNADQFQLNSLAKFLLEKEKFVTFFDDEVFPEDLTKDRCLALNANVIDESGLLKTKLLMQFEDCSKNVVFTTIMGDSREKDYKTAYHEALREAFASFKSYEHDYKPKVAEKEDLVQAKPIETPTVEKISEVSQENPGKIVAVIPVSQTKPEPKLEVVDNPEIKEDIIEKKNEHANKVFVSKEDINILYAQKIKGGYQIVDSSPKVIMVLLYTPLKDIFIVKDKNEIVYKENGTWFRYNPNYESSYEVLNLKF